MMLRGLSVIASDLSQIAQFSLVLGLVVVANAAFAFFYKGWWRAAFAMSAVLSIAFSVLTGSMGLFYLVLYPKLIGALYDLARYNLF